MSLFTKEVCYISLGSDCSVSYQLRRLGLQSLGTMPFDWMRIDKIQDVISILEVGFNEFARFESYTIKKQSLEFDYFDPTPNTILKSRYKMVHKKYKFILPHEYQELYIDSIKFEEKYSRRILRFLEIGRNGKIHKIYIRLGITKEIELNTNLCLALDKLGIVNYEIKFITLEEWNGLIPSDEPFRWQRDYIPWEQILFIH